jgi:hypothetical protein
MTGLQWERDPALDTWTGTANGHEYLCMRTWADVAVLYHNGNELRRSASDGGHKVNKKFAQDHFKSKEPVCPTCDLPHPSTNPYCFCTSDKEGSQ